MNIRRELKDIQAKFVKIKKQLSEDSKIKSDIIQHKSIKPIKITKELSKLLKIVPNTISTRAEIYHRFYIYIIKHDLLNADQTFKLTERIEKVLDLSKKETKQSLSEKLSNKDVEQFINDDIHLVNMISMLEHNFFDI